MCYWSSLGEKVQLIRIYKPQKIRLLDLALIDMQRLESEVKTAPYNQTFHVPYHGVFCVSAIVGLYAKYDNLLQASS
jgi:hypothetical protein